MSLESFIDYDKNGGQSSNVDSGRGSVAYSSGRRPEASLHDTSADSDAVGPARTQPQAGTSQQNNAQGMSHNPKDLRRSCWICCIGKFIILVEFVRL